MQINQLELMQPTVFFLISAFYFIFFSRKIKFQFRFCSYTSKSQLWLSQGTFHIRENIEQDYRLYSLDPPYKLYFDIFHWEALNIGKLVRQVRWCIEGRSLILFSRVLISTSRHVENTVQQLGTAAGELIDHNGPVSALAKA